MGYTKETFKGLTYQSILRVAIKIIGLVKVVLIARILGPDKFGIFGVATLVLALLETATDTGINVFLIQENEHYKKYLNSAFIISILRGILIAVTIVLLNPLIKKFFNIESTTYIFQLAALVALLRGLVNPSVVKFQKDLRFDKELILRLFLYTIDALFSLYFTFKYQVAEGLFIGILIGVLFEIFLSWIFIKPRAKLFFDLSELKYVASRGKWITLIGIFNYLFHNIDDIFVGKILGLYSLGIYQLSYKLSTVPIYETGEIFGRVTFPVYTKIAEDRQRLKKAFMKITLTISLIVIPFGLFLILFAKDIVYLVLGNKWLEAVPVIRLLALFGIIRSISGSIAPLFYSIKKQEYVLNTILIGLFTLIIFIYPLIKYFGLNGSAIATIIATIFTFPLIIKYFKKEFL